METPKFAEKFGNGNWDGPLYVLDTCPMCAGRKTMKFTGKGQWGCTSCQKGGETLASLRDFFATNDMLANYVKDLVDPIEPEDLILISEFISPRSGIIIPTGFGQLDRLLGGLTEGALTVVTGKRGEGKSSWLGVIALNAIQNRHHVCFYSGELSAGRFQQWLFTQAAGAGHLEPYEDAFGTTRYKVKPEAEAKIRKWLGDKLVLYDNTKAKASERRSILRSFNKARAYFGCDLFIVDNLMTARYDIDDEKDALRAQANFASEMMDFARSNNVHVILVAHPRKGDSADINDSVAGLGDITNMATNVIQVRKASDAEVSNDGIDSVVTISKNREYGEVGKINFGFDRQSKRFLPKNGTCIAQYDWNK